MQVYNNIVFCTYFWKGGIRMIIQHNMSAEYTSRMYQENAEHKMGLMEQLSSGYRLTNTKVDASGATIAQGMRGQIRGLQQAGNNAQDGMMLLDVADGAASQIHDLLQRVRDLSVQSASDTNVAQDRDALQTEADTLIKEMDRISSDTSYNTKKLLDGSLSQTGHGLKFQLGANSDQFIEVLISSLRAAAIQMNHVDFSNNSSSGIWIQQTDGAINTVSEVRAQIGAARGRLLLAFNSNGVMAECLQATESRISDTDMVDTLVKYAKESILGKSITAMLVQGNRNPQSTLSLIQVDRSGFQGSIKENEGSANSGANIEKAS